MQENGAVYDNASIRSEAHPFDVSNTNGSLETNGRECQTSEGQSISRGIEQRGSISDDWERCIRSSGECSEDDVSNSSIKGLEGQRTRTISAEQKESLSTRSSCVVRSINYSDFWKVEPNMGRVANGVSGRVDRLKQLGNAVVPQIPEMIGRAILAAERSLV